VLVWQAGLDSLGAVELRNAVSAKYGIDFPAMAVFDFPTLSALTDYVIASSAPPIASSGAAAAAGGPTNSGNYQVAAAGSYREAASASSQAAILEKLTALLRDIVGVSVGADEPFMEVRSLF